MPFDDKKECNDGRRKPLFSTAVYLLPLEDLHTAMTALSARPEFAEQTPKERALFTAGRLHEHFISVWAFRKAD